MGTLLYASNIHPNGLIIKTNLCHLTGKLALRKVESAKKLLHPNAGASKQFINPWIAAAVSKSNNLICKNVLEPKFKKPYG